KRPLQTDLDARAWIEEVAQGVADEVERKHREHDGEGGEEDEVRGVEQVRAAVVEHGPPAGGGRDDAEPEEAHGGFGEDGPGHPDGALHDHRLNDVGQDVARDDAEIARAEARAASTNSRSRAASTCARTRRA